MISKEKWSKWWRTVQQSGQCSKKGNKMAEKYGAENVCDFSLGNPNVPAPKAVKEAIVSILESEDPVRLHGYTNSNAGYADARQAVADSLNARFGTGFSGTQYYDDCGSCRWIECHLKALLNPGDEVITFAPYFGEYRSYVSNFDGVLVETPRIQRHFSQD